MDALATKYHATALADGLASIDEKAVSSKTIILFADSTSIRQYETLARSKMIGLLNNHAKLVVASKNLQDLRSFTQMIGDPVPSQDVNYYAKTVYPEGAQCHVKQGKIVACPIDGGVFMAHVVPEGGGAERALQLWLAKEV